MYSLTQLMSRSLMALFIIVSVAGQLANAFHVYDIATNAVLKRDAESLLMSSAVSATDHQPHQSTSRLKRYTDYQENALAICCGDCMYNLRTTFSNCYDLCNWNGLTPSPWQRFERQQQQQQQQLPTPVTSLNTNDIHRMLTPRVGQWKTSSTGTGTASPRRRPVVSSGRPRDGRRRLRPGSRKSDRPGRRRNAGARRKSGNETCTCPCPS